MIYREHDVTYTSDSGPAQSFLNHGSNVGQGHSRLGRCCFFGGHLGLGLLVVVLFLAQIGFECSAGSGVLCVGCLGLCGLLHFTFSFDIDNMSSYTVEHHGSTFVFTFLGDPSPLLLPWVRFGVSFLVLLNASFVSRLGTFL